LIEPGSLLAPCGVSSAERMGRSQGRIAEVERAERRREPLQLESSEDTNDVAIYESSRYR
jgi:hypothetical protein